MKLIHTADWHLGNTFHGHSRLDEHRHFLDWLSSTIRARRPDALIVSGDIFDTPNPPAAAERLFYDFIIEVTTSVPGLQVVIIAGNHDGAARLEAPAELLRLHNVYLRGTIHRDEETGETDFEHYILPLSLLDNSEARVTCFAIPYLRPSDYPSGLSQGEGIRWFLDHLTSTYRRSDFRGLPVIVAAHFYASGSEICDGEHSERLVIGGQDCVSWENFSCGASYTALGHLHKAQRVGKEENRVHYSGSALPMSFSEKNYIHGIQWVEIDENGQTEVQRIAYRPRRRLLSIPEQGAASPDEVLKAVYHLPDKDKEEEAEYPYLEIRVLEREPQPSLLRDVSEALSDKAVRFCRMVREVPRKSAEAGKESKTEKLQAISPIDLARKVFTARYDAPMSPAMEARFHEAETQAARQEDEE